MSGSPTSVALVTGIEGGLALDVARQLSLSGATVVVAARTAEAAKDAVADLADVDPLGVDLDVTDDESVLAAVTAVVAAHGRLDILVNATAGVVPRPPQTGTASRADLEEAWQLLDIASFGAWRLTRAFLPLLVRSDHPRVLTISQAGASGRGGGVTGAPYRSGTVGLDSLTSLLAAELATGGIVTDVATPVCGVRGEAAGQWR